jgi:hypothetical protein
LKTYTQINWNIQKKWINFKIHLTNQNWTKRPGATGPHL